VPATCRAPDACEFFGACGKPLPCPDHRKV
jgi:hypothetical protein